jgi:hypothetical protein
MLNHDHLYMYRVSNCVVVALHKKKHVFSCVLNEFISSSFASFIAMYYKPVFSPPRFFFLLSLKQKIQFQSHCTLSYIYLYIYINILLIPFITFSIEIHSLDIKFVFVMNDSERAGLLVQLSNIQQGQVSYFDII